MRSAAKITEIHSKILASSYTVILGTETSWHEGVRNEEAFGSKYNVYRDDRNYQRSEKKSGGGVLVAVSTKLNSEIIVTTKFKEL